MNDIPPIRKSFLWGVLFLNLMALPLIFFLSRQMSMGSAQTARPIYGALGDFRLIEKSRGEMTLNQFKGNVWVVNFMFTHCPGQCPAMNLKMSGLQKILPREIRFASFSVDPQNDTPEVLNEYAKRFRAEEGRWLFFTGEKKEVNHLLSNLHLGQIGEDPNLHSLRFILIDSQAKIRGYYDSTEDLAIRKLIRDAEQLLKERL